MKTIDSPEVANCPHCNQRMFRNTPTKTGVGLFPWQVNLICQTEDCKWFNTGRTVSIDDRGNVYEREIGPRGMEKDFPEMTPGQLARGRAIAEDAAGRNLEEEGN